MEGWMLSTACSRGVRGIIKRLGRWVLTAGVAPTSAPLRFTYGPADRQLNRLAQSSIGTTGQLAGTAKAMVKAIPWPPNPQPDD